MESKIKEVHQVQMQIEEEKIAKLPEIVELYFERADKPGSGVTIRTTTTELFENVVREAARKLKFRNTRVGVLGGSMPLAFVGKTVGDIIRETSTVTFQIASAEMLGAP